MLAARHLLLFLDLHGQPLHVCILEVKGQALTDEVEARQVGWQCCRAGVHGLLKREGKLITLATQMLLQQLFCNRQCRGKT